MIFGTCKKTVGDLVCDVITILAAWFLGVLLSIDVEEHENFGGGFLD